MATDYNPDLIYDPILWDNNPGNISGSTAYGYFDSDQLFQNHGPKFAKWAAKRLGYPMVDLELDSGSFYNAFEEAVMEYSSIITQFSIRENMINLIGTPNSASSDNYINYTNNTPPTNLARIIKISDEYGTEAGVGGNITWRKAGIPITQSVQRYDLNALIAEASASGNAVEIKKIYHHEPAIFGYGLGGLYGAGYPNSNPVSILGEFGWEGLAFGGASVGTPYTLMPLHEDLLRIQSVELNLQIRRSAYGFEVKNNQLVLFPVPTQNFTLWIDYILKSERYSGTPNNLSGSNYANSSHNQSVTTNLGDAPYTYMSYSKINDPGRRWIYKYGLACVKEILGEVRSKFQSIPIPNAEIQLNGDTLKQEAQAEKEQLITTLREDLERTSPQVQMQIQAENTENVQNVLDKIPMKIYIG